MTQISKDRALPPKVSAFWTDTWVQRGLLLRGRQGIGYIGRMHGRNSANRLSAGSGNHKVMQLSALGGSQGPARSYSPIQPPVQTYGFIKNEKVRHRDRYGSHSHGTEIWFAFSLGISCPEVRRWCQADPLALFLYNTTASTLQILDTLVRSKQLYASSRLALAHKSIPDLVGTTSSYGDNFPFFGLFSSP